MDLTAILRWPTACVLLAGLAGCFPYHGTESPAVSGRIVDSRTHRPVSDATVRINSSNNLEAKTDARGAFMLPRVEGWSIHIVGMEFGMLYLIVDASGHGSTKVYLREGDPIELDRPIELSPTPADKIDPSFLPARPGLR